ncbi:putative ankyrin repeat domain-containing protein 20A12 [Camelus dromedarius]|uniref:Putative ankyrin repeat domain-containing protein 20A12 n=1 Tax=Camelus dromedarius TaxID=9838 RepID=A0A5N4E288_CAMDR|nr:putative ankyrin repeat domain-containing protein 20A12 [Camelus dromedarius]KAB1277456.1 putative ankyrin repeat domain-containing protein 20A12 [Camelus dromedarius]
MGKLEAMSRRVLMLEKKTGACVRQLQQELTDTRKKVSMLEASLEVTAHYHTNSENEKQESERKSHQAANPNADLPDKWNLHLSVLLHLSAETQRFLKEIFMKELQRNLTHWRREKAVGRRSSAPPAHLNERSGTSPVEQYKRETEERARRM